MHDPVEGIDPRDAADVARDVIMRARELLRRPGAEPPAEPDAGLRPTPENVATHAAG